MSKKPYKESLNELLAKYPNKNNNRNAKNQNEYIVFKKTMRSVKPIKAKSWHGDRNKNCTDSANDSKEEVYADENNNTAV